MNLVYLRDHSELVWLEQGEQRKEWQAISLEKVVKGLVMSAMGNVVVLIRCIFYKGLWLLHRKQTIGIGRSRKQTLDAVAVVEMQANRLGWGWYSGGNELDTEFILRIGPPCCLFNMGY